MQYSGVCFTTVVSQTHTFKVKALISQNEPKSLINIKSKLNHGNNILIVFDTKNLSYEVMNNQ